MSFPCRVPRRFGSSRASHQLQIFMRVSYLYVIFCLTTLGLSVARPLSGQPLNRVVALGANEERLSAVLNRLMRQTDFSFVFPRKVNEYTSVNLPYGRHTIKEVLDVVLQKTDLSYEVKDNTVVIYVKEEDKATSIYAPMLPPLIFSVIGTVLDGVTQQPLPGVNILIKGTAHGTSSDSNGKYTIDVNERDVLVFSFIGFKTFETIVNGHTAIDVLLESDALALQEVTVSAGYYTTTDLKKTGSIVKISAKDIENQPVTSPLMALQGRMPGVDITPNSGVAGAATKVVIRGQNSITNTNATPLYIIDGIPVNSTRVETDNAAVVPEGFDPLSTINPANIESIEVLKDADATAIYGSRGANGVILITTKRGNQSEKTNLDITCYSGAGKIPRFLNLLTTPQYISIRKEALGNANIPVDAQRAPDLTVWDTTRNTNWQKELLGTAATVTDLQVNISGGNLFTNFRFGASYHKEGMIAPGDFGFRRVTGNFSLNHNSSDQKFRTAVSMNYGVESNKLFSGFSLTDMAVTLAPDAPELYDAMGNLNWQTSTFNNPLAALKRTDNNQGNNFILNSTLSYEFVPGLSLRTNLGYNSLDRNSIIKKSPFAAMDPATITDKTTAASVFGTNKRSGWIIEPQATYDKRLDDHELNVVIGTTWQENSSAYQLVEATGYSSDVLLESLKGATQTNYVRDEDSHYRYMAIFGRIGYNYKHKYMLNLTGRRDGSSRFGPEHRWGNFGALGAAWIFSEENLMQHLPFISFGKIRGSYGITGSDQVGDYQYLSTYKYASYTYQGRISLMPTGLSNADYAWEQTAKFETALELGILHDRLHLEVAFYRNRCANQLLSYQLPGITGFAGVTQNLKATVENKGLELSLNAINIDQELFQWRSSLNFTLPQNKLLSYPGIEESPDANTYVVGQPLSMAKLYNYVGVNPTTGLYQVKDIDGNGIYDYKDQTFIQNTGRQYYGGLNNTIRYKGVELSFLLQFSQQTSFNALFYAPGSGLDNLPQEVMGNYWRQEGDIAKYQKAIINSSSINGPGLANASNASYVSSSFIRLKTLSLSYALSQVLLDKVAFKAVKFFLQGQNLATFSSFPALDPEAKTNSLPPLLMITVGLEIKL